MLYYIGWVLVPHSERHCTKEGGGSFTMAKAMVVVRMDFPPLIEPSSMSKLGWRKPYLHKSTSIRVARTLGDYHATLKALNPYH